MMSADEMKDDSSTPYDDVFRTLLNDCTSLIFAVINEAFHENYTGNERIEFQPNEHFVNQQDGKEQKRITDSVLTIYSAVPRRYHIECESTADGRILIRIFEYDAQIALDNGKLEGNTLRVKFPNSAVLYLRSTASTPDAMKIIIETAGGEISYDVPVIKVQEYSLEEIFEKGLLFLIPFYIFKHERRFEEYEGDAEKLKGLVEECRGIRARLEELAENGKIDEYTKCTLEDMSKKVAAHLAQRHEKLQREVTSVMGGKILEYEAKTILREGMAQGRREGITIGEQRGITIGEQRGEERARRSIMANLIAGGMEPGQAAAITGLSV